MSHKYQHSLVGGTFDRFHLGHQKLLKATFAQSEKVSIGVATNELFSNKDYAALIEDYRGREIAISQFLLENDFKDRATIVPIHNIYGSSVDDNAYDAIFVTEKTKPNAIKINKERKKKGLEPLDIITVPFVFGDDGEIISSERVRGGQIDRYGKSYAKLFAGEKQFVLPEKKREELRQPIGPITTEIQTIIDTLTPQTMLIAVGDIVAASASQVGRPADINIIDGKTRRHIVEPTHAISSSTEMTRRTSNNPSGTITQEATNTIIAAIDDYRATHKKQLIDIFGEEDLLAIPAILLAPLDSVVIYGQFDQGIVTVTVSEQNKKHVQDLFRKFQ